MSSQAMLFAQLFSPVATGWGTRRCSDARGKSLRRLVPPPRGGLAAFNGGVMHDDDTPQRNTLFARPGTNSALRAATRNNPRVHPCPRCKQPNRLTPADVRQGYQCDACADAEEGCC